MIPTLWLITVISIFALMIGIVISYKYQNHISPIRYFKQSSLMMKGLLVLIMFYILSLPVQLTLLYRTESHHLNYGSTYYNDMIEVEGGYIAVGSKDKSGPTLTKYDYSGKVIWRKSYEGSNNFFVDVEETSTDNIVVSIYKGYYDQTGHIILTYNKDGELLNELIIPDENSINLLEEDRILSICHEEDEDYDVLNQVDFTLFDLEGRKLNQLNYNYEDTPTSEYVLDYPVDLVGQTDDYLFIKISAMRYYQNEILEERLLVLSHDLKLVNEFKFDFNKQITKILNVEDGYYILWNNYGERKSMITHYDQSFNLINQYEINNDSSYMELNDMIHHNGHLYLVGNLYVNQDQIGFTDDLRGVMVDFDLLLQEFTIHSLEKGIGLNKVLLRDDSIYGVGFLNTHSYFLSNSYMHDNPYMGLMYKINLKDDYKVKILDVLEDERYR